MKKMLLHALCTSIVLLSCCVGYGANTYSEEDLYREFALLRQTQEPESEQSKEFKTWLINFCNKKNVPLTQQDIQQLTIIAIPEKEIPEETLASSLKLFIHTYTFPEFPKEELPKEPEVRGFLEYNGKKSLFLWIDMATMNSLMNNQITYRWNILRELGNLFYERHGNLDFSPQQNHPECTTMLLGVDTNGSLSFETIDIFSKAEIFTNTVTTYNYLKNILRVDPDTIYDNLGEPFNKTTILSLNTKITNLYSYLQLIESYKDIFANTFSTLDEKYVGLVRLKKEHNKNICYVHEELFDLSNSIDSYNHGQRNNLPIFFDSCRSLTVNGIHVLDTINAFTTIAVDSFGFNCTQEEKELLIQALHNHTTYQIPDCICEKLLLIRTDGSFENRLNDAIQEAKIVNAHEDWQKLQTIKDLQNTNQNEK